VIRFVGPSLPLERVPNLRMKGRVSVYSDSSEEEAKSPLRWIDEIPPLLGYFLWRDR